MRASIIGLLIAALVTACGGESADLGSSGTGARPDSNSPGPATSSANIAQLAVSAESKIVISSSIDLQVEDLRATYTAMAPLVRSFGGYVADASISDSEERSVAAVRLRVPAARHDELLTTLRSYNGATVRTEKTNAKEITEEYTDLQSRVLNLRRTEVQYQELVGKAGSVAEILQVSAKLDEVRGEIEKTQGRLNLLSNQSDFATVSVGLSAPIPAAAISSPVKVFNQTMAAAWTVALVLLNLSIVLVVAAGWLLPLGAIGLLAWRIFGKTLRILGAKIASW